MPAQREVLTALASLLRANADTVDSEATFPSKSLDAIRASGLMALQVPEPDHGMGGDLRDVAFVARILGSACVSTALIWAMHCQQVAVLVNHADQRLRRHALGRVVSEGAYIASATTEASKGGHLTSALAPLTWRDAMVEFDRYAPVVTGGAHADAYLMTMRRDAAADPADVVLLYADRESIESEVRSEWSTMGVRGTESVGMQLSGAVPAWSVVDHHDGFSDVAAATMVPAGHVAWAAVWLGAAEGALRETLRAMKDPKKFTGIRSIDDLTADRIARIRLDIDIVESFLRLYASDYQDIVDREGIASPRLRTAKFKIRTNNLKVVASEATFGAVDRLVQLLGLSFGYRQSGPLVIERAFRDLRSAAPMYSNDRLLLASGKLAMFDVALEPFVIESAPAAEVTRAPCPER
jgi:alkylation response protein AidB-like acyl-CoA dehydrogenase